MIDYRRLRKVYENGVCKRRCYLSANLARVRSITAELRERAVNATCIVCAIWYKNSILSLWRRTSSQTLCQSPRDLFCNAERRRKDPWRLLVIGDNKFLYQLRIFISTTRTVFRKARCFDREKCVSAENFRIFYLSFSPCAMRAKQRARLLSSAGWAIDCFKCVSIDGDNKPCDDPFHNNGSLAFLESPCLGGRKGRDGLFPATACIKIAGVYGKI